MDGKTRAPWWLQSPYVEQLREVLNREPKQQLVPYRQLVAPEIDWLAITRDIVTSANYPHNGRYAKS